MTVDLVGGGMAMTPAERKAKQRASLKAGYCVACVKRKARAGKKTCKRCNEAAKERVRASRESASS